MPTGPAQSGADTPQAQDLNTDLQTPDAQQQETPEQQQGSEKAEKLTEAQEKAMNEKRKSIQKELKNFEKHHNEATGEVKEAFKDGIQKVKEVFKNYESGKLVEEEAHKTFKSEISTIFRSIQHTDRYSHDGESQQEKSDRKERRKKLLKKYEAFRGELLNQAETGSPAMQKAAKKTLASLQKNFTTKTEDGNEKTLTEVEKGFAAIVDEWTKPKQQSHAEASEIMESEYTVTFLQQLELPEINNTNYHNVLNGFGPIYTSPVFTALNQQAPSPAIQQENASEQEAVRALRGDIETKLTHIVRLEEAGEPYSPEYKEVLFSTAVTLSATMKAMKQKAQSGEITEQDRQLLFALRKGTQENIEQAKQQGVEELDTQEESERASQLASNNTSFRGAMDVIGNSLRTFPEYIEDASENADELRETFIERVTDVQQASEALHAGFRTHVRLLKGQLQEAKEYGTEDQVQALEHQLEAVTRYQKTLHEESMNVASYLMLFNSSEIMNSNREQANEYLIGVYRNIQTILVLAQRADASARTQVTERAVEVAETDSNGIQTLNPETGEPQISTRMEIQRYLETVITEDMVPLLNWSYIPVESGIDETALRLLEGGRDASIDKVLQNADDEAWRMNALTFKIGDTVMEYRGQLEGVVSQAIDPTSPLDVIDALAGENGTERLNTYFRDIQKLLEREEAVDLAIAKGKENIEQAVEALIEMGYQLEELPYIVGDQIDALQLSDSIRLPLYQHFSVVLKQKETTQAQAQREAIVESPQGEVYLLLEECARLANSQQQQAEIAALVHMLKIQPQVTDLTGLKETASELASMTGPENEERRAYGEKMLEGLLSITGMVTGSRNINLLPKAENQSEALIKLQEKSKKQGEKEQQLEEKKQVGAVTFQILQSLLMAMPAVDVETDIGNLGDSFRSQGNREAIQNLITALRPTVEGGGDIQQVIENINKIGSDGKYSDNSLTYTYINERFKESTGMVLSEFIEGNFTIPPGTPGNTETERRINYMKLTAARILMDLNTSESEMGYSSVEKGREMAHEVLGSTIDGALNVYDEKNPNRTRAKMAEEYKKNHFSQELASAKAQEKEFIKQVIRQRTAEVEQHNRDFPNQPLEIPAEDKVGALVNKQIWEVTKASVEISAQNYAAGEAIGWLRNNASSEALKDIPALKDFVDISLLSASDGAKNDTQQTLLSLSTSYGHGWEWNAEKRGFVAKLAHEAIVTATLIGLSMAVGNLAAAPVTAIARVALYRGGMRLMGSAAGRAIVSGAARSGALGYAAAAPGFMVTAAAFHETNTALTIGAEEYMKLQKTQTTEQRLIAWSDSAIMLGSFQLAGTMANVGGARLLDKQIKAGGTRAELAKKAIWAGAFGAELGLMISILPEGEGVSDALAMVIGLRLGTKYGPARLLHGTGIKYTPRRNGSAFDINLGKARKEGLHLSRRMHAEPIRDAKQRRSNEKPQKLSDEILIDFGEASTTKVPKPEKAAPPEEVLIDMGELGTFKSGELVTYTKADRSKTYKNSKVIGLRENGDLILELSLQNGRKVRTFVPKEKIAERVELSTKANEKAPKPDTEMEAKFRLQELPESLKGGEHYEIRQVYLDFTNTKVMEFIKSKLPDIKEAETSEVRILMRKASDGTMEAFLTAKGEGGLERYEAEVIIDAAEAQRVIESSPTKGEVVKERYVVEMENGLKVEVDVYKGEIEGLVTAEVEFQHGQTNQVQLLQMIRTQLSLSESGAVDVTEIRALKNKNLAKARNFVEVEAAAARERIVLENQSRCRDRLREYAKEKHKMDVQKTPTPEMREVTERMNRAIEYISSAEVQSKLDRIFEGLEGIPKEKLTQLREYIEKNAVEQHFDNPEQYVSHGFDHSLHVMHHMEGAITGNPAILRIMGEKYGLSNAESSTMMRLLALFHDFGYPEAGRTGAEGQKGKLGKALHAVTGAEIAANSGFRDIMRSIITSEGANFEQLMKDFKDAILYHSADKVEIFRDAKIHVGNGEFIIDSANIIKVISAYEYTLGRETITIECASEYIRSEMMKNLRNEGHDLSHFEIVMASESRLSIAPGGRGMRFKGRAVDLSAKKDKILGIEFKKNSLERDPMNTMIRVADNCDMTRHRMSPLQSSDAFRATYRAMADLHSQNHPSGLLMQKLERAEKGKIEIDTILNEPRFIEELRRVGLELPPGATAKESLALYKEHLIRDILATKGPDGELLYKADIEKFGDRLVEMAMKGNSESVRHFGGCECVHEVQVKHGNEVHVAVDKKVFEELNQTQVSETAVLEDGTTESVTVGIGEYQIWRAYEAYKSLSIGDKRITIIVKDLEGTMIMSNFAAYFERKQGEMRES